MKNKPIFLLTSLCTVCLLTSACTTPPTQPHDGRGYHEQHYKDNVHKKHTQYGPEHTDTKKHYKGADIKKVKANMMTHSSTGGTSEMGVIWFKETKDGLKMTADLVDLRPNKTYTTEIYQCDTCGNDTCCETEAMSIDLPEIKTTNDDKRLKQSYMVQGATAEQLNNAKLILTRDGGYKAAWGTLKQK